MEKKEINKRLLVVGKLTQHSVRVITKHVAPVYEEAVKTKDGDLMSAYVSSIVAMACTIIKILVPKEYWNIVVKSIEDTLNK